jgi:hypothetical protein
LPVIRGQNATRHETRRGRRIIPRRLAPGWHQCHRVSFKLNSHAKMAPDTRHSRAGSKSCATVMMRRRIVGKPSSRRCAR